METASRVVLKYDLRVTQLCVFAYVGHPAWTLYFVSHSTLLMIVITLTLILTTVHGPSEYQRWTNHVLDCHYLGRDPFRTSAPNPKHKQVPSLSPSPNPVCRGNHPSHSAPMLVKQSGFITLQPLSQWKLGRQEWRAEL